eukprot:m.286085 g.286085  ORF g.286085 m.286085 type:complete len:220 (+) comp19920_c1_seq1:132-791(+)
MSDVSSGAGAGAGPAVFNEDQAQPEQQQQQHVYNTPGAPGYTPATWRPPKWGNRLDALIPDPNQQMVEEFMASCATRTVIAGVGGFVLGGMFGLFMSGMSGSTGPTAGMPMTGGVAEGFPLGKPGTPLPTPTFKDVFRSTGRSMLSTGKNFAFIGGVFSATECSIESYRGEYGLKNSVAAGCITGGALGLRAGAGSAVFGCATFGAFSLAIDYFFKGSM